MNKIFIITHKKFDYNKSDLYEPLTVGAVKNKLEYKYTDDTGINISEKNMDFCELTGLYWIWKNTDFEITGLVHYRRYLAKGFAVLDENEIKKDLSDYDILIAKKFYLNSTIQEIYNKSNLKYYLEVTKRVINENYSDYCEDFNYVLSQHYTYPYNIMICKKNILDSYCEWLFDILFEVEKQISRDNIQYVPRAYGYISENMLYTWIKHNGIKYKNFNVYHSEKTVVRQMCRNIYLKLRLMKVMLMRLLP